jgi:hypothetical protein
MICVVVTDGKDTTTLTLSRPIGQTSISKNSFVVNSANDIPGALRMIENPFKLQADRAFERAAISSFVREGFFTEKDGKIYYNEVDPTTGDVKSILDKYTRQEHLDYAKSQMDLAIRKAKANHMAAETAAGRDGKKRPDGRMNPKPKGFDTKNFKITDYMEYGDLEKGFQEFKKNSPTLAAARKERKALLERHEVFVGETASKPQLEAKCIRGHTGKSALPTIVRTILWGLENHTEWSLEIPLDVSDEEDDAGGSATGDEDNVFVPEQNCGKSAARTEQTLPHTVPPTPPPAPPAAASQAATAVQAKCVKDKP